MVKERVLSFYLHRIVAAGNVKDGWADECLYGRQIYFLMGYKRGPG